jgi:hypothetical protein
MPSVPSSWKGFDHALLHLQADQQRWPVEGATVMTYNPHLEDCAHCHHEWQEGDEIFGFYEDYICKQCAEKMPHLSLRLRSHIRGARPAAPRILVKEQCDG